MPEIVDILRSLSGTVDLGFFEVPMFVAVSAMLVLLGLGLRKSWLTLSGVFITFAYSFLAQMSALI